jgi:hypothetical protein
MQTRNIFKASEIRQRMIAQGLNPERTLRFLENAVQAEEETLNMVLKLMSKKQATSRRIDLLNGQILLSIFRDACYVFTLLFTLHTLP